MVYRKVSEAKFLRQVATLVSGAVLAQGIPLVAAPLLTRFYTPEALGVWVAFVTWLSNLAVVATARYELAIILPKETEQAANLMALALLCCAVMAVLGGGVGWLLSPLVAEWEGLRGVAQWMPLVAVGAALAGAVQTWINWNNRHQFYRLTALSRVVQSISLVGVQLVLGMMGWGSTGLVLGQIMGQITALFVLMWHDINTRFSWRHQVGRAGMHYVSAYYRDFPRVNAPTAFINALQDTLAAVCLMALAGPAVLGFYGLVVRVLKLPAALVGQAIAQVFYRTLTEAMHAGDPLAPQVKKMMVVLFIIALPPFFVISLLGAPLFEWVFGSVWREAGSMAQAAALYILFHFVASPLGMVPLVLGRQKMALGFTLVGNMLYLSSLVTGLSLWQDVIYAFGLISCVMAGYFAVYLRWLYCACKVQP